MIEQVVQGVMVPAVLATLVLVLGWRPWRRTRDGEVGASSADGVGLWAPAVAFTLAFCLSFMSKNWPAWFTTPEDGNERAPVVAATIRGSLDALRPSSRTDWIVYLALASGVIGVLAAMIRRPGWVGWLAGPAIGIAVWLIIKPLDNPTYGLLGVPGLCGAAVLAWLLLEPLAARRQGASLPLAFMLVFTGLSIFVFKTGGLSMPLICGAMSAVCAAALVLAWLRPTVSFARGGTPFLASIPPAILWLQAWYYFGEAGWYAFPLMLAAYPLLWLGELPVVTNRPAWVGVIVRAVLAAIPAAAAVVLAMNAQPSDPYSEMYG